MSWSLFEPPGSKKKMREEYPELGKINEFKILKNSELVFVWHTSCSSSPIASDDATTTQQKINSAITASGLKSELTDEEVANYKSGNVPERIRTAIKKMKSFSPSIRMRAKLLTDKMFKNAELIIDIPPDQIKEWTVAEKNSYANLIKTVNDNLPALIKNSEDQYGIRVKASKKGDSGNEPTIMDKLMSEK